MQLFNFRNGFFVAVGFSVGYYKGIQHGSRIKELVEDLRHDPQFQEILDGLKDVINNPEKYQDVEGNAVEKATVNNPALGTTLSYERIVEINTSTPDNPVILTDEEIKAMRLDYVKVNLGRGRFKIRGVDGTIYDRTKLDELRERGDDLPEPIDSVEKASTEDALREEMDEQFTKDHPELTAKDLIKPGPEQDPDRPAI